MAKLRSVLEKFNQVKQAVEEEKKKPETYNNELKFNPQLVKGEERTKFRLRFLEVTESPTGKPWVQYNYHMFEREGDNKYIKVIDPRTFDPKAVNPIADRAKALYNSDNPLDQEMAGKFYRKPRYFTVVYVKEAPENQKELTGKVLVWEAGVKVFGKLEVAMKDFEMCFWDPYKGRDFLLVMKPVTVRGRVVPNYDDSAFIGSDGPISVDEKIMNEIGDALEKISIKKIILDKEKIKSGAELLELMNGGKDVVTSSVDQNPVKEMVSGGSVSMTVADLDFGEVKDKPKQEKVEVKKVQEVEKPVEVVSKESTDDMPDFDITFNDDDFKNI